MAVRPITPAPAQQPTPTRAEFFGLTFTIMDHAGRRWLTAEQVGRALGYHEANVRQAIIKLHNRHREEFTEEDSCVVNLTTQPQTCNVNLTSQVTSQTQSRNVRIFSDTGCIKLGFFAATARAREFRAWAARVLAAPSASAEAWAIVPTSEPLPPLPVATQRCPAVTRAAERRVLELFVQGYKGREIARHVGLSAGTVSELVKGKYRFSPSAGTPQCPDALIAAVVERHRVLEAQRWEEQRQRIAQQYCASSANLALASALDHMGRELLREAQNTTVALGHTVV